MKKTLIIGITLLIIVSAFAAWEFIPNPMRVLGARANNKITISRTTSTHRPTVIPTNTPMPTTKPIATYVPLSLPTATPTPAYQNYGWYMHDGQSMQYLNSKWYSTPQQNILPTSAPTQSSTWSSANCPQNITTEQCKRSCQGLTSDECEEKCHGDPNDQC